MPDTLDEVLVLRSANQELQRRVAALEAEREALREGESTWQALWDSPVDSILLIAPDGIILGANQTCARRMERRLDELVGQCVYDLLSPDVAQARRARFDEVVHLGTPIRYEDEYAGMHLDESVHPVFSTEGRVTKIAIVARDITARKRAEEALRESELRFRTFVERAPLAISVSRHGIGLYANQKLVETFGLHSVAEAVGRPVREHFAPQVRQASEERTRRRSQGLPAPTEFETIGLRPDGAQFPIHVTVAQVELADGMADMAFVSDISERVQADEALRDNESKYRRLVDNANEAIVVAQDGLLKFVNRVTSAITGYTQQELTSRPFLTFVHPDDRGMVAESYRRRLRGDAVQPRYEFRLIARDGSARWVEIGAVLIEWEGRPATLNFLDDITERVESERRRALAEEERRKLQGQLLQAQKMEAVGQLAGGVAHDFNNMLTVILGHADLAMGALDPAHPLHADLEEIRKAARRSTEITRQLLAFARKQTIAPKVLDLNETVEGMLKMLRRLIGEDIALAWRPQVGLWPVKVDPSQVDQIMANLCVNARDAIGDARALPPPRDLRAGNVTIETGNVTLDEPYCAVHLGSVPGDYVLLVVSDDGCGMDQDTLAKIFEPFFTTKPLGQGTGLGLATVYGIVKQNGGYITVYSERGDRAANGATAAWAPGHGTTFRIYLPRHAGPIVETRAASAAAIPRSHGETILLVEDELAILHIAKRMLEAFGYRVLAAGSPDEALRLAEEQPKAPGPPDVAHLPEGVHPLMQIHLLITDVVMPGMSGRELAQRLLTRHPHMRCLYMSGYTADAIAHRGVLDEGANFVSKPLSAEVLAAKVREVLDAPNPRDQGDASV